MDDLIAFATARLDEEDAALADDARDDGARFLDADHQTERFLDRFAGEDRIRREIAAKRAVLAWYADSVDASGFFKEKLGTGTHMATAAESYLNVIKGFTVASWGDHPDYRAEWAPGRRVSGADDDAAEIARERDYYLTQLRAAVTERQRQAEHEQLLAHGARTAGISWDDIAAALGTTPDEARQRFGEPQPGADPF